MNEEVMYIGLHRCGNKIRYTDYKGTKIAKAKKFNVRKQVSSYVQQILEKLMWGGSFMERVIQIILS
jgi:hypothetical protein